MAIFSVDGGYHYGYISNTAINLNYEPGGKYE